eukprot:scaffold196318_cov17-Tisochrysis_lutea.AAC.1
MLRSKAAFVYLLTTRELRRHFGRSIQLNLEQLSRPSSQTTWLKVKPHCNQGRLQDEKRAILLCPGC